ncbi:MAG: thermonuclease family protein [Candidatus Accumulibacter sp.]|jgi:endonuclease YncB( thermonuclease family)|nr:thermonuclease family protein [Accumulibacter sp.]
MKLQLACLALAFAVPAAAADLSCLVVGVADGDTLTALCPGGGQVKVRLGEIDAPETRQAFGRRSRQSLADLCFGRMARIIRQDIDAYGRSVARVHCAGVDANAEQVARGMAWVYARYAADRNLYALETAARAAGRGLWAGKSPVPPWEFRRTAGR